MAAGYRSRLGFWVGGFAGDATPPLLQDGGYRALPGFWLGGFAGESGEVEPPEPPSTGAGGGEPGRGAKRPRRKRIEWLPPDYDIETGERRPAPDGPVKLSKGERRVARLVAQYRGRDDDVAERAAEQLEALHRAQNSELARFIARQQALDDVRSQRAAVAAEDDEAAIAFMQWLVRQP
jgi:hypothetical protein